MAHTIKALAISIGAALALTSLPSHAEITLLKQDPQAGDPLSRLNFTVGGSIRPQFNMMTGDGDKGSYKRNGFDGGTRFRFAADYYLFDDISWISYYELGVNIPALFDWDNHYAEGANNTTRRSLRRAAVAGAGAGRYASTPSGAGGLAHAGGRKIAAARYAVGGVCPAGAGFRPGGGDRRGSGAGDAADESL